MARSTVAVMWAEASVGAVAVGSLSLTDGRAVLEGASRGSPRHFQFAADEVEATEMVGDPAHRLGGRPTLAIGLRGRGRLLLAQTVGFGAIAEIVDYLEHWRR